MKKITLKKNEHQYVTQRLSAWIDHALSEQERARVKAHLEGCEMCRQDLESLLWTKRLLRQTPIISAPRSFVVRPADLEVPSPAARWRPLVVTRWATALVSLLLVIVLLGDLLGVPLPAERPKAAATVEKEIVLMRQGEDFESDQPVVGEAERGVVETVVVEKAEETPTAAAAVRAMAPSTSETGQVTDEGEQTTNKAEALLTVEATSPPEETLTAMSESPEVAFRIAQNEPLPEETPMYREMTSENRPSRLVWRIAEIGLGMALAALIVLWIVMRKRI